MSTKSRKRKQRLRIFKTGNYKRGYPVFTFKRNFKICLVSKYKTIRNRYLIIQKTNMFLNILKECAPIIISKSRAEGKSHELCMNILRQGE